jgi:hypothetical protein
LKSIKEQPKACQEQDEPGMICGAMTREGKPCTEPPFRGSRRCRIHGGAPGSGAPQGNQNALKHGLYTKEAIVERKEAKAVLLESLRFFDQLSRIKD